ncbi:MAG: T9SS type A sorting domain-containing protein [Bacteroidales bacterium]|nr:T9SS type A sorting domain-containing protein [Bacteroidales bacterium]
MKKILLATLAILWLLTGTGGKIVAQENIAVWKFPTGVTNVTCVSDLISESDCIFTTQTSQSTQVNTQGTNHPNTMLCGDTDNTKSLQMSGQDGGSVIFKISTSPFRSISISYDIRCHPNMQDGGYSDYAWSYSTNGTTFIDAPAETAVSNFTATTFTTHTADFSSINDLNGQSAVWFKLTMSGAPSSNVASNLDNVVFSGNTFSCYTPINVTAVSTAPNQAVITWDSQGTNEESYTLVYYTTSLNNNALNSLVSINSPFAISNVSSPYTLTGLTANTNYYIYVRSNCGSDDNSLWASTTVRTPTVCTISDFESTDVAGSTASLSWTTDADNTMIRVFTAAKSNPWETTAGLFLEETVTGTSYELTGLNFSTTYYVYAKSVCSANNISETVSTSFTTNFADNVSIINIGEGTSTSSYLPTYSLYNYSLTQQIYTADEMGLPNGGSILSIAFYNGGSDKTRTIDLYMLNSSKSTFTGATDWVSVATADRVYSGSVTFTAGVWTTITLDTPFEYDGASNFILIVDDNTGSWSSGLSCRTFSATTNQSLYVYNDGTNYNPSSPSSYSGTITTAKNQLQIVATPAPASTCPKPTDLTTNNVSATSATITWHAGGEETAWTLKYGPAGFDVETAGTEVSIEITPTYALTGLAGNSEYDVYIKAVCSDTDESAWKKVSFETPCTVIVIDEEHSYTEGFESTTCPNCWSEATTGSHYWTFGQSGTHSSYTGTHSGSYNASYRHVTRGDNCKLISPVFDFGDMVSGKLEFWRKNPAWGNDIDVLSVYYRTSSDASWTLLSSYTSASSSWVKETVTLPNVNSSYQIAFEATDNYGYGLGIDDIVVRVGSSAAEITAFSFAEDAEAAVINSEEATVTCLVSYSTESLNGLVPTIAISDYATISPASGVAQDFSSPFTYTVTAENETEKIWTVNVSKVATASSAKDILSFSFANQVGESVIDTENKTVSAYAAWNYNFANNITPTITVSPLATISPASGVSQNFARPVTYTVTAEDESYQEWTVTINNDPDACVNPMESSIVTYDLEATSATIAWVRRYLETSYNVKVSTTAMTDMTATADVFDGVVNDTAVALTGLTANTQYYIYVQSACGIETWVNKTITTPCGAIEIDDANHYVETFENYSSGLPDCWRKLGSGTVAVQTSTVHNGSKSLKFNGATSNLVVLPLFTPEISNLQFTLWSRPESTSSNYSGSFDIGYVTNVTDETTFTVVKTYSWDEFSGYAADTIYMPAAPAGSTFAMRHRPNSTSWYWFVDDIDIGPLPTCMAPQTCVVSDITTNSASVTWTDMVEANAWQYQVNDGEITDVTVKPINISNLSANTSYTVKVRMSCGGGEYSDWSSTTFRTDCGPLALPYRENLDDYTATAYDAEGVLPPCWTINFMGSDNNYAPHVCNSDYYQPNTGSKYFIMNVADDDANRATIGPNSYALLPELENGYAGTYVSFETKASVLNRGAMTVGYMIGDTYTNLTNVTLATSKTTFSYVVPGTVPSDAILTLKLTSNSGAGRLSVGIDNVYIREASSDNTILSYAATTEQGDAICNLDNEAHTISVELRSGYVAGATVSQTIALNDENATIKQQVGSDFVNLPASFTWYMTTADTTITYKVIAENGNEQIYTATVTIESCAAPSVLTSEQTSMTNVNCSWTPAEGTSAWNFYYTTTQLTPTELNALTASDYTTVNTTSASATVVGETTYYWYLRTDCSGSYSAWQESSFTTWENCAAPTNLETSLIGDNDIMITWDVQDNLPLGEGIFTDDFERQTVNGGQFQYTNDATYPWQIVLSPDNNGTYCIKSSNAGVGNSQSTISMTYTATANVTLSFKYWVMGESATSEWDYMKFTLDGVTTNYLGTSTSSSSWTTASHRLTAGEHTMSWSYVKDNSVNGTGDCAYIDDITLPGLIPGANSSVVIYKNDVELVTLPATQTSYTDAGLEAGHYCYTIKTVCREGSESELSAAVCQDINDCLAVTNLSVGSLTDNSAVISWTRGEETSWNLKVNDGTPIALTETTEGITVNGDVVSYSLTGLESNTTYTVSIQSNCDGTLGQNWTSANFTTERTSATLPYVYGFEDATENTSWILLNGTHTNKWYIGTASNNGGANGLYVSNDNGVTNAYTISAASNVYAYRSINIPSTTEYFISFDWMAKGESCCDYLRAFLVPTSVVINVNQENGITTNTTTPDGWYDISEIVKMNDVTEWQHSEKVMTINSGFYNLVFYWRNDGSVGTNPPASIDNINIHAITCPTVGELAADASSITNNSAVITWVERGSAEAWEIVVSSSSLSSNQLASAESVTVTEPTYSATGLNAVTTYYVYVRANCGTDDNSEWTSLTFATVADCATPEELQTNNVSAASATITWNGYTATQWTLEYRIGTTGTWTLVEGIDEASYTLTTTGNTTYNVRIKAVCGEDVSDYSTILSFTTPCEEITELPYIEEFDEYAADIVPSCWDNSASTSTTLSSNPERIWGVYSYNNNKMLRMYNFFVQTGTALINSQPISLPSEGDNILTFDYSHLASCGAFTLKISTNGGSSFSDLGTYEATSTSYNYTNPGTFTAAAPISLAAYAGETIIMQFFANANYGSGAIFVDNIVIHELSSDAEIVAFSFAEEVEPAVINSSDATVTSVVAYSTESLNGLVPTISISNFATISPASGVAQDFTNPVIYTVTAENGTIKEWTVNVNRMATASSEKDILSFTFNGQVGESVIDATAHTVTAVANMNIDLASPITPTIEVSPLATISPTSGTAQTFTEPVTYIVTAEDESTQEWIVSIVHDFTTLANLPYSCDFEDATENSNWVLDNGSQTNKWYIGTAANNGGETGLYISNDNGTNNSYGATVSYVYAYRQIIVEEAGNYDISFDWKANGESTRDLLRAFVIPTTLGSNIAAGNANGMTSYTNTNPTGWIDVANPSGPLQLQTTWQHSEKSVSLEAAAYNLVFFWKNDGSVQNMTPAAIDNISIASASFTITASVTGFGTIDPSGEVSVAEGADQTFTMTPMSGFALASLMVDGVDQISQVVNNTYTFENVSADHTIVADFQPEHIINATAGNGGTISPSGQVHIGDGGNITFTVSANEGYRISSVLVDNVEQITSSDVITTYNYEFSNVTDDHTITASFVVAQPHIITATASAGGTISPSGQVSVPYNGSQTFEFTPDEGYRLANIVVDNGPATAENNTYTFTNVVTNHTINANFAVNSYNLTIHYVYANNTTAAQDHTETIAFGTEYSVASPAITGYTADIETVAGTMPANDVEATVTYNVNSYTLTIHYVYADNTTAAPDHIETVAFGATYSVESPVLDGYTTDQLTVAGTMPADDVIVTVRYTENSTPPTTYTITASAGNGGSINPNGTITVNEHDDQSFSIRPNDGYHIARVLVDNEDATANVVNGLYTFRNVTANHTINVTFEAEATPTTYTITASAGNGGSINPNGTITVNEHDDQQFSIRPNDGYHIARVLVDNEDATANVVNGLYTFRNVTANHTINVTFEAEATPTTYTITASAGNGGSINPNGTITVNEHDDQSFSIRPNDGYRIERVLVDNEDATANVVNGLYTFRNVTANHTIAVTFEEESTNTYTIIASAGPNGTINPNGVIYVNERANQAFRFTPENGYRIASVTVDGNDVMDEVVDYSYTFYDVRADHTIYVTFTDSNAVDEYTAGAMSIYPNPNNGMFSIDFNRIDGDATYQLIDARGAVDETRDINVMDGDTMKFNHNLRPGSYFVRIITADKVYVEQIVVE